MSNRTAPKVGDTLTRVAHFEIEKDSDTPSGARRRRFVASDETVDRYGDIIRANGWQLDNFRKNPVLLFSHKSRDLPVGRVDPIAVEGTRLIAHAEFMPEGVDPFADTIWQMVDQKFLSAVSVGFMPLAAPNPMFDENQHLTGFEYIAQELLELSVVPVPANPNALQLAKEVLRGDAARIAQQLLALDAARIAAERRSRSITLARLRRH